MTPRLRFFLGPRWRGPDRYPVFASMRATFKPLKLWMSSPHSRRGARMARSSRYWRGGVALSGFPGDPVTRLARTSDVVHENSSYRRDHLLGTGRVVAAPTGLRSWFPQPFAGDRIGTASEPFLGGPRDLAGGMRRREPAVSGNGRSGVLQLPLRIPDSGFSESRFGIPETRSFCRRNGLGRRGFADALSTPHCVDRRWCACTRTSRSAFTAFRHMPVKCLTRSSASRIPSSFPVNSLFPQVPPHRVAICTRCGWNTAMPTGESRLLTLSAYGKPPPAGRG